MKLVGVLAGLMVASVAQADVSNLAIFRPDTKDTSLQFSGVASSNGVPQHIMLIDSGIGALKKRLDMIESARHTIDVQYFIYSIDRAGRLFTQALIRKAQQGVKVRMMIDTSKAVFDLNRVFVNEIIRDAGVDANGNPRIEIKYYNLDSIIDVVSLNFRSHRKEIIIDNKMAITGGRNLADEYFGLSSEYNFLDSDFFVEGSVVRDMTVDFEDFWNSPISSVPAMPTPPSKINPSPRNELYAAQVANQKQYRKLLAEAHDYTVENDSDRALLEQIRINGEIALKKDAFDGECTDLSYVADHPGIGKRDGTRVLAAALAAEAKAASQKLVSEPDSAVPGAMMIESPYFIPESGMFKLADYLKQNGVQLKVMTNSLNSTDAFYTVAAFDQRIKPMLQAGVQVSIYDGSPKSNLFTAEPKSLTSRWGTHAKRAVIGNTIMVGTFNIDPRSKNLNAEMAMICRDNKAAALWTKKSMDFRNLHAVPLNTDGQPADGRPLKFGTTLSKKVLYWLSEPFALFFGFLF